MARGNIQTKVLCVKKFGWQRIAKDRMCFGWELNNAEEHTETTSTVSYNVTEYSGKYEITPEVTHSTKVRIWLSFLRDRDRFENLGSIALIELFYKLVFTVRRILSLILPVFAVIAAIIGFLAGLEGGVHPIVLWFIGLTGAWLLGIVLEVVLARIAAAILRRKY